MPVPAVVLLGASGYVGRLVAAALDRRGIAFSAVGRDRGRLERAVSGLTSATDLRTVDVGDPTELRRLLTDAELLITTVGPFDALGRDVLAAAVETRTHYVDTAGEQPFLFWAKRSWDEEARDRGVTVVPAAGIDLLPGDLLSALAADQLVHVDEVHVAYAFPDGLRRSASPGTRRTLATLLGQPVLARVHGQLVEEQLAATRRLAWFPRPVGPSHAAAIPGGEPLSVPEHVPTARTVRTYVAMTGAASEMTQLVGNLARWAPARRRLERLVAGRGRPEEPAADAVRHAARWACVAEAAGGGELGRAWAYGRDPYGLTAEAVVTVAQRVLAGTAAAGVIAPARVDAADQILDDLAARTDLRWTRVRTDLTTG